MKTVNEVYVPVLVLASVTRENAKCHRYQGVAEILAKLPPAKPIWHFNVLF
jgi:hypothetical protein